MTKEEETNKHICTISKEQWDVLFSYIPKLTIAEEYRSLSSREKKAVLDVDGSVTNFYRLLYEMELIISFGWTQLAHKEEMVCNPDFDYSQYSAVELLKVITMIIRADRFNDGIFAWAVGEGVMARLLIELQDRVDTFSLLST